MDWELVAQRRVEESSAVAKEEGREEGMKLVKRVFKLSNAGTSTANIAKQLNITESEVKEILE
jgi:DNA-binding NarL/FixJ family response regulator